jgi:hypothetical protein
MVVVGVLIMDADNTRDCLLLADDQFIPVRISETSVGEQDFPHCGRTVDTTLEVPADSFLLICPSGSSDTCQDKVHPR